MPGYHRNDPILDPRHSAHHSRVESVAPHIATRSDVSPNEGEHKYGDVQFADPTNKKYPVDTPEHIRAAWDYINHPANASKYSGSDASAIKQRICVAAKSKGIDISSPGEDN